MTLLYVRNIHTLATMDEARREIADAAILIRDRVIEALGTTADLDGQIARAGLRPDETLDLADHVVLPGFVNTHHHMAQSLLRAVPAAQNFGLFEWIAALTNYWIHWTPDMIYTSAVTAMAELILSGCTTSSDHLYIYPNGSRMDDEIRAAWEIGLRFHPGRGSISLNGGGLLPDHAVETEPGIERDTIRLIDTYHEADRLGMVRIVIAPGSPFSVSHEFMRQSARLARSYGDRGIRLHTHFLETKDDIELLQAQLGLSPEEYLQEYEWAGDDVWHAHCVHMRESTINLFRRTGTGVAHCPHSNMRLGVGIAPIPKMFRAGVRIGLGVDGSASNDGGHMIAEARQALMLARAGTANPAALTAREAIELATRGGASVLGRDDIGYLAPGMAADLFAVDLNQLGYAGGLHDPVAAVVLCAPVTVDYSIINGRVVVREGQITGLDLRRQIERHNAYASEIARKA
jgi:cytosine/adenosine deaminase-related metal-dependent hydrolase